jgi:hypothetical protein
MIVHVRTRSTFQRLFRVQDQTHVRRRCAGAELRGRLEQAADGADAGRGPIGGRQARPEDDALGPPFALGEGRENLILDVQRQIGRLHDEAGVSRCLQPLAGSRARAMVITIEP